MGCRFAAALAKTCAPKLEPGGVSSLSAAPPHYRQGERVALFVPCYVDQLYPEVGRAVVTLLERLGVALEYPIEQTCCGQPAFNSGYWGEATAVAAHFARVFGEYAWIVAPSGSCTAMCRAFYPMLALGPETAAVGARVYDLATFLVDVLGVIEVGARFPHVVTYHDGCHGRRELGAGDAAVKLLRAVKDLTYVELPGIEECCGFGGTFSVKFDELSASMGKQKCENALQTGAQVLVSGDSSCLMQIAGLLRRDERGRSLRALHLAEVLAAT